MPATSPQPSAHSSRSSGPRFVLVAGESSGDLLGAGLLSSLRARFPDASFAGVGGARMAAAGMDVWYPSERLSVMGLVEVLRHLPGLLAVRRDVYKRTLQQCPDVFIGIDAPDFNLGLERRLKQHGIRTAHYVSPSVWAWRESRAANIGRSADRVLCLFPMEPPIYARHGVDARFVGHPLADIFPVEPDKAAARRQLGLAPDVPVLALLPGSRLGEIKRLGADFLGAVMLLKREFPTLRIVAPMATPACRTAFENLLSDPTLSALSAQPSALSIIDGNAHAAMIAADAVLLASGTAALEAMLAKRPMVVAYRVAWLTYKLVKLFGLLRTNVYSLPNILAGRQIVPELMQDACTPAAIAAELAPALRARSADADMLAEFRRLHESLRASPAQDAGAAIADLLAVS
ncbi:MAG TPA: lipid-A-disaccharide synthase [Rhodanobacteraceae bacterium]|jgi:lipid-A-disaccharide synthase|nr:lipid-A-disaccharide synthase [Rhodanobacteraceae bacterium]